MAGGPQAAAFGAAGFGVFSFAIDKFMERWEEPNDPKKARKDRLVKVSAWPVIQLKVLGRPLIA